MEQTQQWPARPAARIARGIATAIFGVLAGSLTIVAFVFDPTWRRCSPGTFVEMFQQMVGQSELFMPTLVLTIFAASAGAIALDRPRRGRAWLAALLPVAGAAAVIGITVAVHLPINQWVADLRGVPDLGELAAMQQRWSAGHLARTVAGAASFGAMIFWRPS